MMAFTFGQIRTIRNVSDVFVLQDSIAAAITAALQLQLTGERIGVLQQSVETTNPEAFQAFLQARYFSRLFKRSSSEKALEYATRAIELDPSYARAYALRAEILLLAGEIEWTNYPEAVQEAGKTRRKLSR